jgi:hypothetical protein
MLMLMQMQYNYGAKHLRCYRYYAGPSLDRARDASLDTRGSQHHLAKESTQKSAPFSFILLLFPFLAFLDYRN